MKLQDNIDFTALNWVKHELDATLKQGRDALEAYVDNPSDVALMRESALHLHQVQGTLRMVELYGAAMVVEEMERVAQGLLDDTIRQREEAYSVLMRGMVQLPDYLERVQSGHKDIPIVLLPLLNDLRACRGDNLLTESALFQPDLHADLPRSAAGAVAPLAIADLRSQALRLRLAFQAALLKWFRDESAGEHLDRLGNVLDRLRALSYGSEPRRLWWVAGGTIEAVRDGALEASIAVKLLFGGVDRDIRRFAEHGENGFVNQPPRDLVKNLLYYIAHSTAQGPRASDVRAIYRLDALLPTQKELQHAQGSMTGHNRNLLDTVSIAIKEDLLRVKESLDIFLRSQDANPADLASQAEILDRVGDTLGMLGLGMPRKVVSEQRNVIEEMSDHRRSIDEGALLDVAGALLYVEASLDDHIERLGAGGEAEAAIEGELELPKAEVRKILDALMREAAVNIQQAKHDIIAFIESPWEHARVEQIPRLLEEISGALRMLGLGEAAQLMTGIVRFVETELLQHRRVPTAEQMDKLADALAAIEYYLEATREQRGNRERILNVTRESLEALGYWPVPSGGGGPGAGATPVTPAPVQDVTPPEPVAADSSALEAAANLAYGHDSTATVTPSTTQQRDLQSFSFDVPADQFPSWGDHLPSGRTDSLRDASNSERGSFDMDMPSIDLPNIDLDIDLSGEWSGEPAPTAASNDAIGGDVPSVVEIAPGHDIGDLIVGETHAHEPFAHDLAGLRLAETGESEAGWTEIEEEIEEEVPVELSHDAGFQHGAVEDIDDEIREVFVEEVQEEIENMQRNLPLWKADIENLEALKPIRRSFHTLKGSGRLVGALTLGEFSWKVENMLNRVLDGTVVPGSAAVELVDHAIGALPELLGALRGGAASTVNVHGIMHTADRIAAGEDAHVPARHAARKVRRVVRRRVPLAAPTTVEIAGSADDFDIESAFAASPPELHAGPLPNIDPVLFDILKSEVAAHLGVIGDYLDRCVGTPVVASEMLLRAVHTLNGAIAMVDIPALGHVLAPLEGYIKRLRGIGAAPSADGIAVLEGTVALAREVVGRLDMGISDLPDSSDLVLRVTALRDALPEPETSLHLYSGSDATPIEPVQEISAPVDEPVFSAVDDEVTRHRLTPAVADDEDLTSSLVQSLNEADALSSAEFALGDVPADIAESLSAFDLENPPLVETIDVETPPIVVESEVEDVLAGDAPAIVDATLATALHEADAHAADETAHIYVPDDEVPAVAFEAEDTEDFSMSEPASDMIESDMAETVATHEATMSIADEPIFTDAQPATPARVEPPPHVSRLTGVEAPPIAEDAQPDGALELPDMDDDLLSIFVQEGADILDHSDSLMARLREAPNDRDLIVGLQRDLHTLKGGARMAGLAPIGDLSHAMESLIDIVSEGRRPMDRVAVESLERGFDRLHALVQRIAQLQAIAMPLNAIARFEGLVAGEMPADVVAPSAEIEAHTTIDTPDEAVASSEQAEAPVVQPAPAPRVPGGPRPAPRHLPTFDEEDAPRAPQEMIRVRSELLDSLVNYAGEVSIYRSRLEQQISTFRFNLIEFEQTVSRLREQLRKLEIETEAQIIARYQREHHEPGQTSFDPLELDRFSQLQQLSRALGESVSDLVSIQGLLDDLTRQSETLLLQQSRVSSDLQEGLMRTRMVPFDSLVPNLRRTLRQAAQELGKRAQLRVDGAQGEMDRNLLERMKAPFEHMLRNALAHGIEAPDDRLSVGKPAEGTVNIAVSREATEVVLRVSDDGHGMDREAIRLKAIERGLLKPDVELSDRDLYGFVLETGFSTAEQVTQLSGRGVGMDVVHNEIKQLGGSLLIDSVQGRGATFTIRLPFTLAVTQAILVKLGDNTYAIPMSSVQGVVRIARDDLDKRLASGNPKYSYAGEEFNIYELSQLLGVPPGRAIDETQLPLLMTRTGDQRAAVRIDAVVGSREIVVKSVGPQISSVPGIFGATIMGDGSVVMILDLAPLVRRSAALRARIDAGTAVEVPVYTPPAALQEERRHPLIMVVDDSITMRKVTTRVLERAELDVITAKDGLDAVEKLQEKVPDLMLLDIEMPRMDGYELAAHMKADPRLRGVPIIMITSRSGEKHRQRAFDLGVERYLGKPYQEADLLAQIEELLAQHAAERNHE